MTEDKKPIFEHAEGTPNSILYTGGCTCAKKKSCKNYICLGQSGAGKSTFLDSFIIYLLNQGIHDKKRYKRGGKNSTFLKLLFQNVQRIQNGQNYLVS